VDTPVRASTPDGRILLEFLRFPARDLPLFFLFWYGARPLLTAEISPPPPFGLCMRSRSAVVRIEGPCFVFAQGRAACSGPFLLHVYQPPEVSRSVRSRSSRGLPDLQDHYRVRTGRGMFQTVCAGFGLFRIDSKTLTGASRERLPGSSSAGGG